MPHISENTIFILLCLAHFTSHIFFDHLRCSYVSELHSFSRLNIFNDCRYLYHISFIQSSVPGHCGGLCPLAAVNNAAMSLGVQSSDSVLFYFFVGYTSD